MEYCQGGELIDLIVEGRMDEEVAKRIFAEIAAAVYYCHQRKICHRDLKPENILLLSQDFAKPEIKIIDFGLSAMFTHEDRMKTLAGTVLLRLFRSTMFRPKCSRDSTTSRATCGPWE